MFVGITHDTWKTARVTFWIAVLALVAVIVVIAAALTPGAEGAVGPTVSANLTKPAAPGEAPAKGCCLKCRCGLALHNCCDGCTDLKAMPDAPKKEQRITEIARSLCATCCTYKRKAEESKH